MPGYAWLRPVTLGHARLCFVTLPDVSLRLLFITPHYTSLRLAAPAYMLLRLIATDSPLFCLGNKALRSLRKRNEVEPSIIRGNDARGVRCDDL
eukprot:1016309-Karenia_brevis.AAC.1